MNYRQFEGIGYHGTCSSYMISIEDNGLDPSYSKYRDDHWLGQGVYFFEDNNQAMWWAKDISHKNDGSYALIYSSEIVANNNEVLNLDNNDDVEKFYTFILKEIDEIEKKDDRIPVFNADKMKAVYFDYYKVAHNISVIIKTFNKDAVKYGEFRKLEDLKKQKRIAKATGIYYSERQICVSKKDCIRTSKIVYNEIEEVI